MSYSRYSLLLIPLLAAGLAPAARADGNAPGLGLAVSPKKHAAATSVHQGWLRQRADQLRFSPRRTMINIAAPPQVDCTASATQLAFDFTKLELQATTKLTIKSTSAGLDEVYLYGEVFGGTGTLPVADKDGALTVTDMGYSIYAVTLRKALTFGETLDLVIAQSGKPDCKPTFLGIQTCMLTAALTYDVSGAWQPLVYDLNVGLREPSTATIDVTVPSTMSVAVSGLSAGTKTNPDGTMTWSFTSTIQGGGFGLSVGPFVVGSTPFGAGKQARSYVLPAHANYAGGWRQAAAEIITFHEQRYGSFDLPKIDIAEVSDAAGAAFGPLSTVFIPSTLWQIDPGEWAYRATLAHELGHQWFAGFIAQDDPYSPWLSEGFASFSEMAYTIAEAAKALGYDYGPAYRASIAQEYIYTVRGKTDVPMSSEQIYKAPSDVYVAVTYSKGSLVVNMLRTLAGGDAPFFAALQKYRADHVGKKATVESLTTSLAATLGKDLTCFMTRWVKSAGYPIFTVDVRRTSVAGKYGVDVTVTSDKEPCLPLELAIDTVDGKSIRKTITMSGVKASASFPTDAEVSAVRLDPDRQILGRKLGALAGDLVFDGEVDGVDLIYAAWAQGRVFDPKGPAASPFPDWADISFDGSIDPKDLDIVLGSFGKNGGQP